MSKSYILATLSAEFSRIPVATRYRVPMKEFRPSDGATPAPTEGDQVLVVTGRNGVYEYVEPHVFNVASIDNDFLVLSVQQSFLNSVPIDKVRPIINRALSNGGNLLEPGAYEAIINLMGGIKLTELQLLDHIKHYITARGYYFDDETIHNYHICLKTRPFVILAGLSGTGKSKLSQLYAEAMGHNTQNERYLRLAVRPGWNDDRYLLGYFNSITGEYVTEPAIEFIIQAEKDRDNLYFFCLDEMNLAHVEYYFSQFLSALEEENPADRVIPLYSKAIQARLIKQDRQIDHDREVIVPLNLLFTGTINVDETTQPLSDKVIDRANTLEFFEVDLDKIPTRQPAPDVVRISAPTWRSYITQTPDSTYRPQVIEIAKILNQAGLGLGYRVLQEIEVYMGNSVGLLKPETAFDLQIKQRILPRVRGTITIQNTIRDLIAIMKNQKLSRSHKRLEEMESRLKRDGYTSFWR